MRHRLGRVRRRLSSSDPSDGAAGVSNRRPFNRKRLGKDLDKLQESAATLSKRAGELDPRALTAQLDEIVRTARGIEARYGDVQPQRLLEGTAPPLVVFVHVPRTAGSTLAKILGIRHGAGWVQGGNFVVGVERGRLVRKGDWEERAGKVRRRAEDLAAIATRASLMQGHVHLAMRGLFPPGSRLFTFLRDPSSRTLSHYHYFLARARRDAEAGGHPPLPQLSLSEYVHSADRPAGLDLLVPDNLQTRMLSGLPLDAPASKRMLDSARRNLAGLDMVGITEQFAVSVALLHRTYGWTLLMPPARRYNATKRAPAPEDVEAARELNQLDEQLYAEGLAQFEHTLGRFGPQVEIDAAAMTRGWEIVEGAESATTPDGDAGADDAARAEQIDARATEIVADTRELLSTELLNASRRAGRLVMYSELLAEARAGMLKAGDKDLEPRARKLDREMISNASGVADGHENHARRVAAALRALLGRVESTAPTPDSDPDEVVSLESAPFR